MKKGLRKMKEKKEVKYKINHDLFWFNMFL